MGHRKKQRVDGGDHDSFSLTPGPVLSCATDSLGSRGAVPGAIVGGTLAMRNRKWQDESQPTTCAARAAFWCGSAASCGGSALLGRELCRPEGVRVLGPVKGDICAGDGGRKGCGCLGESWSRRPLSASSRPSPRSLRAGEASAPRSSNRPPSLIG